MFMVSSSTPSSSKLVSNLRNTHPLKSALAAGESAVRGGAVGIPKRHFLGKTHGNSWIVSGRLSGPPVIVIAGAQPLEGSRVVSNDYGIHVIRESALPRVILAHPT